MNKAIAFIKRGLFNAISYPTAMVLKVISLFITVASFYYLALLFGTQEENPLLRPYGGNYLAFLIVGVIFQYFTSLALGSFSREISDEQKMGTLEFLLMSRTKLGFILIYAALWEFIWNTLTSIVILVVGIAVFGIKLDANLPLAILTVLLTVLSLSGIGMASAGIILITKQGDPIAWALGVASGFLSGVYYPIDVLPPALKNVSLLLPTTHALIALRQSIINNATFYQLRSELIILSLFSLVTIPLGLFIFSYGFNRARTEGSLSHY